MLVIALVLMIISIMCLALSIRKITGVTKLPCIDGELVQVDLISSDSSSQYEATYRYELNGNMKIFISDKRGRSQKAFDKHIKLYCKNNGKQVVEKPTCEMIVVSLLSTVLCLIATIVFTIHS